MLPCNPTGDGPKVYVVQCGAPFAVDFWFRVEVDPPGFLFLWETLVSSPRLLIICSWVRSYLSEIRLAIRTAHDKNSSIQLKDLENVMDEQFMIHAYSYDFMRYEHLDFFVIHCYPERWRTFSGARQAKRSVAIARWHDWGENRGIQLASWILLNC